jgi:hypothetical protein
VGDQAGQELERVHGHLLDLRIVGHPLRRTIARQRRAKARSSPDTPTPAWHHVVEKAPPSKRPDVGEGVTQSLRHGHWAPAVDELNPFAYTSSRSTTSE